MQHTDPKPRRRWLQFGIAEVLFLIAILGIVWRLSATWPVKYVVPKGTVISAGTHAEGFSFTTAADLQ